MGRRYGYIRENCIADREDNNEKEGAGGVLADE